MTYNIHTYLHTYMNTCHTIPVYIPAFHYIHAYIITPIHYRRHYIAIHTCIHTYMHTYMYNTSSSPGHEGRDNTSLSLSLALRESCDVEDLAESKNPHFDKSAPKDV